MKNSLVIKFVLTAAMLATGGSVVAQGNYSTQQVFAEMQRVTGQIDVLQNNFDELSAKVSRLEGRKADDSIQGEIAALRNSISELRREMQNQRQEIVNDLLKRINKAQPSAAQRTERTPPPAQTYNGPCQEYVVQSGDSLYMVAIAFKTTVAKLKAMNNLKSDNLKVGQKLLVPKMKD